MKKKRLLPLGILAVLVLAALIYTRPMTLEAMFGLDITQSELVYTDYLTVSIDEPGRSVESSEWLRGEERTETLISLLSQQKFRRSLRNLLPLETTSDMPQNNLIFDADFSFNDGQDYLYFQSSFGQLNLFSTTGNNSCSAPRAVRRNFCSRSMTCSLLTLRNNQEVIFMKRRHIVLLGILAVLVLSALIYTRPMTLQEIGKVDIAQCESVSGYHRRAPDSEFTSFELSAEDERCSQLIDLFAQQKYRRSLINLLSPDGGSTHRPKDGDFIWDLSFNFGPTDFPDGSTGEGVLVTCRNFFGKLSLFRAYDGKAIRCTVSGQDEFLQQVYDIISAEP